MKTRLLIILCLGIFSVNAQTTYQVIWGLGANGTSNENKTIEVGDTVEWIWNDTFTHTVTGISGSSVEPDFYSGFIIGMGMVYSKTFTVEGVNDYQCDVHPLSMFGTITVTPALGVDDETFSSFKMYPNPSNSILNLKLPQYITVGNVMVYDVLGKMLLAKTFEDTHLVELNISNLVQGVYLIKIKSGKGSQTKQFVKN